jgi:hypothetical protein
MDKVHSDNRQGYDDSIVRDKLKSILEFILYTVNNNNNNMSYGV